MRKLTLAEEILRLVPATYPTKKAVAAAAGITENTLHNVLRTGRARQDTLAKLSDIGVQGIGTAVAN